MQSFVEFIQTDTVIALLIAILIFIVTIFLVVKNWISFSITFLLLLFAIASGLAISNHRVIEFYLVGPHNDHAESNPTFDSQLLQAIESVQSEVAAEKENIHQLVGQVEEMLNQMDVQKQKLQTFISETQKNFQKEDEF